MCVVAKRNFEYPKSLFQSTANFSSFEGGKLKSNHQFSKRLLFVILLGLVFCLTVNGEIQAQSDSLILEVEQHWDTYGVGGTCIGGGHNLAVADVDEDGVKEMITGGSSYNYMPNGSKTPRYAPLKIWNWNGQNITLEKGYNWTGNLNCVYAGDADGDGKTEIITAGRMTNSTGSYTSLRIWSWDGETLVLRGSYEGTIVVSVVAIGVSGNGKPNIITVGTSVSGNQSLTQLSIWQFDGRNLILNGSIADDRHNACANSVYAYDLNNDGETEIVTAGYANDLKNSTGQLNVWQWDGQTFSLIAVEEWRMVDGYALNSAGGPQGNTIAKHVKVADVDGDSVPEIVTSGFTYDGTKVEGQLRIWNWSGGVLNLEKSQEWENLDITEPRSMSINDVDGDGKKEIVTSGYTTGYGSFAVNAEDKSRAELKVWSWDGNTLTLKQSKDWIVGESVSAWNVGTGDVDNDGVVEIVTVGCMQTVDLRDCDPDLRIWSIPSAPPASFPYLPVVVVGAAAAAIILPMAAFLFMRKRRQ